MRVIFFLSIKLRYWRTLKKMLDGGGGERLTAWDLEQEAEERRREESFDWKWL